MAFVKENVQNHTSEDDEGSENISKALENIFEARQCASRMNYARGLRIFFQALQLCPAIGDEIENDISICLQEYGKTLFQGGHVQQVMWLYAKALEFCPDSKLVRHNLGAFCSLAGRQLEALHHFQAILCADPDYWPALEGMENVKNLAVDRWHFRMLNDSQRNCAYDAAIRASVQQQLKRRGSATVLDIGTGTGILALMALRAGATKVFACETNATLCELAMECVTKAGCQGRVTIINKSSLDLVLGEDVPEKFDLVVTELVDSGLLGEHIIPTLMHAKANLLKEGGQLIPSGAEVHGVLLESPEIRQRGRLLDGNSERGAQNILDALFHSGTSVSTPVRVGVDEPYTCENLEQLPHCRLSGEHTLFQLDFTSTTSANVEMKLPVIESGQVDAVAMWFKLFLLPDPAFPVVDTSPGREGCGWDQGIYFIEDGYQVHQGEIAHLCISYDTDRFSFSLKKTCDEHAMDVSDNRVRNDIEVGEMDMAQLNDYSRFELYRHAISALIQQGHDQILDFCSTWSLLGLTSFHCRAKKVVSYTENSELIQFILKVAEKLEILPQQYEAYNCSVIDGGLQKPNSKFNLIVGDLIEGSGLVRQQVLSELIFARDFLSAEGCKIVPATVSVVVQCIDSMYLVEQNFVDPANTALIDISSVNSFSVTRFREVNLNQLNYTPLADSQRVLILDLHSFEMNGEGLVCEELACVTITNEGNLNAICYWFEINLLGNPDCPFAVINTGPCSNSLRPNNSVFNRQAAIVLEPRKVRQDETITLKVTWTNSYGILIQTLN